MRFNAALSWPSADDIAQTKEKTKESKLMLIRFMLLALLTQAAPLCHLITIDASDAEC